MRIFASLVTCFILAAVVASCSSMPDAPAPTSNSAKDYFFQFENQIYTYSQDHSSVSDTVNYKASMVDPADPYHSFYQLKNDQPTSGNGVLYYFNAEQSSDGSWMCLLSNSSTTNAFVALKGTLDLGATWYADNAQNIQAAVVGKYAEYFLPGRQVHYEDVVVVKYTDKTSSPDNYIVRYFARDYGLIFERTITGPSSDITDLQLLARQGSSNTANPDDRHDRWFNANGRYMAHMTQDDDLLKK